MSEVEVKMKSLWGPEVDIIDTKEKTNKIIKKSKAKKEVENISTEKIIKSKKVSIEDKIKLITENVNKVLEKQKNNILVIKDRETFRNYINDSIKNGIIAVDTETNNSLDPITCKLMGLCLYTPNNKQVYIPVNHVDYKTNEKLSWQLTEQDCKEELQRLIDAKTFVIMHNGKFDYQVLKCTCGVEIEPNWDTIIASKLINENEPANLKTQYILHVDSEQEKYSIENLFEGQEYSIFPPEVFALYAATDSLMTYKVYEYQKVIMELDDYKKIYKLFKEVEMPCVIVTANMELMGVEVDLEYAERLSKKYHDKLNKIDEEVKEELEKLKPQIDEWRKTDEANYQEKKINKKGETVYSKSKSEQLDDPINLASPVQLSILLYDILKIEKVNFKSPRATGEEELKSISKMYNIPLCNLILKRRECSKLLSTYIDNIPELAKIWGDHRLRSHFNQYGADTGRFSSGGKIKYRDKDGNAVEVSGINYQNIPSHNKEIRLLFKASKGNVLIGSDYSAQEPRTLSQLSGDETMIKNYVDGKDLYATIAMSVYKNSYWDNMEHHEDGTPNPEGKKRRSNCKSLLLGIMYSRGVTSIAEQINGSIKDAQNIVDNFYKSFPRVKDIIEQSHQMAKKYGYVEDLWGRRRRLPDIQLPRFEIKDTNSQEKEFNPFINCADRQKESSIVKKYLNMLNDAKNKKEKDEIIALAKKHNLEVKDNSGYIAQAERQCLNARIQGSAATTTKIAMNKLFRDKELNDLGFKLLIGVHDELIGECPEENVEKVAKRFTYVMSTAVSDVINKVPFKCDADVCKAWYYNDYCDVLKAEYNDYLKMGIDVDNAKHQIYRDHTEMTHEQLDIILK